MKTAMGMLCFFAGTGMEARSWQLRLGPTEKAGFLRQAVVVGQQLLAITFPQERDPSVGAGLWAWEQQEGAFRLLLPGRFSGLAAAEGGSFWVVSSLGSKLEKYSLAGQKLSEEALPFYALALGGEGEDLVSLRVPASGSGNLFWRRQGGKWKPWALPPTAAQEEVGVGGFGGSGSLERASGFASAREGGSGGTRLR